MAQSYPSYPSAGDVQNFLTSFGVLKSGTLTTVQSTTIGNLLAARIQSWERLSGYTPFLCAQDSFGNPIQTTRLFNPPGNATSPTQLGGYYWFSTGSYGRSNRLFIECGFTAISQILVDVTFNFAGNLLVYEQDYLFQPNNVLVEGKPYTEVEFLWNQFGGLDQSISITGNFGYGTVVPADAWQAIVYGVAADLMPMIGIFQLGDAQSQEEKDVKEVQRDGRGESAYDKLASTWDVQFRKMMANGGYVRERLS